MLIALVKFFVTKTSKNLTVIRVMNQSFMSATTRLKDIKETRIEKDSLGTIHVPQQYLWGAQTQRSLENFPISEQELMPKALIRAMGIIKLAAAKINRQSKKLDTTIGQKIELAAQEVIDGKHYKHFPLVVWQTGSGTQTNMNTNEVVANRAIQLLGGKLGDKTIVHPNDHVNMGQSSNDTFPTAMHISAVLEIQERLIPSLQILLESMQHKSKEFSSIVKIGRTHLQDATPLTLGQEFSAFEAMISYGLKRLKVSIVGLLELAQGGTAVGTGLNTYEGFAEKFAEEVSKITGVSFKTADNKFASLSGVTALVDVSSVLSMIAADLLKISNDIRLLSSGPRSGFGEIILPANEPGSSIMPGKINPTQCEALSMVCAEVIGNHTAVTVASTHGHLQLNVFRPVIIYNVLRSVQLLGDATKSFAERCVVGIEANHAAIEKHLSNSLMLITALTSLIGYDKCAKIALYAHDKNLSLKQAGLELGFVDEKTFDDVVKPEKMISPSNVL